VQLFTIIFQQPVAFGVSILLSAGIVLIVLRAAMSAEERRPRWVRWITSSNMRMMFTLLFVGWAVVFGIGLQLVPHEGANSPYGGIALIAMFSGFFIMMGFLWAVIGE
jgi:hypothetical protein